MIKSLARRRLTWCDDWW